MINSEDYLALVKSLIALCREIITFQILREEIQGNKGFWRYRLTLKDSSFLEMFEFFEIQSTEINIIKYSFHWQTKEGKLIKRWDNARAFSLSMVNYRTLTPNPLFDKAKRVFS